MGRRTLSGSTIQECLTRLRVREAQLRVQILATYPGRIKERLVETFLHSL
jgi:hypothetical protein